MLFGLKLIYLNNSDHQYDQLKNTLPIELSVSLVKIIIKKTIAIIGERVNLSPFKEIKKIQPFFSFPLAHFLSKQTDARKEFI